MADDAEKLEADLLAALGVNVEEPVKAATDPAPTSAAPVTNGIVLEPPPISPLTPVAMDLTCTPIETTSQPPTEPRALPDPPAMPDPIPSPPKRPREPDDVEANEAKRLKTEPEPEMDPMSFELDAVLQNALGAFDQQFKTPSPGLGLTTEATATVPQAERPSIATGPAPTPAPRSPTPAEKVEDKYMKASENSLYMLRSMSLPVIGNHAVQILLRLSQQSRAETEALLADAGSEFVQAHDILKRSFTFDRMVFSESAPLLFPDDLGITDSEDRETIRMANLASASLSAFGTDDVTLEDIHDNFHSIFIPEDGEYNENLTDLFLALKTESFLQAQTSGISDDDLRRTREATLDKYLPVDFKESLIQRNGDGLLQTGEDQLVTKCAERREVLLGSTQTEDLRGRFPANTYLDSLSSFLRSHLPVIVDYAEKYGVNIPLNEEQELDDLLPNKDDQPQDQTVSLFPSTASIEGANGTQDPVQIKKENGVEPASGLLDEMDLSALIAQTLSKHDETARLDGLPRVNESAGDGNSTTNGGDSGGGSGGDSYDASGLVSLLASFGDSTDGGFGGGADYNANQYPPNLPPTHAGHPQGHPMLPQNHMQGPPYPPYQQNPGASYPPVAPGEALPPNQTEPTRVLYERARQAAVSKTTSTARREGIHSTRRPWTPDEERALMTGLDMVKGPHWSQILILFGPNGTISDVLKDRTQVQLKDKARNLKLFFLKTESEMPYYLQSVTGELKTRAPGQAARKEAEEKARLNSDEEQARIQGIMTLAGGLQNKQQPSTKTSNSTSTPSPAVAPAPTPGSASQAMASATPARASPVPLTPATSTTVKTKTMTNLAPATGVSMSPLLKSEPHEGNYLPKVSSNLAPARPAPAAPSTQHRPQIQPNPAQPLHPQTHHQYQPQYRQQQPGVQPLAQQQGQRVQRQQVQQGQQILPPRGSQEPPKQPVQAQQPALPQTNNQVPKPLMLQQQQNVSQKSVVQQAQAQPPPQPQPQHPPPSVQHPASQQTTQQASTSPVPHQQQPRVSSLPPISGPPSSSTNTTTSTSGTPPLPSNPVPVAPPAPPKQIPGLPQIPPHHHTSNDTAQDLDIMKTLQEALNTINPNQNTSAVSATSPTPNHTTKATTAASGTG